MARITETPKTRAAARVEGIIKEGLSKKQITYSQLAERIGITPKTLKHYRDDPRDLTFSQVARLSDVLGIPEEVFHNALRNASSR